MSLRLKLMLPLGHKNSGNAEKNVDLPENRQLKWILQSSTASTALWLPHHSLHKHAKGSVRRFLQFVHWLGTPNSNYHPSFPLVPAWPQTIHEGRSPSDLPMFFSQRIPRQQLLHPSLPQQESSMRHSPPSWPANLLHTNFHFHSSSLNPRKPKHVQSHSWSDPNLTQFHLDFSCKSHLTHHKRCYISSELLHPSTLPSQLQKFWFFLKYSLVNGWFLVPPSFSS